MQVTKSLRRKQEELVKNTKSSMKKFVSPGVHTIELDTNTWTTPKHLIIKWKIAKFFDLDTSTVIVTSIRKDLTFQKSNKET
jgi:replicative DNA helicase